MRFILSDRRGHLDMLYKMLNGYSRGFYVGGMKPDELKGGQEKKYFISYIFNGK